MDRVLGMPFLENPLASEGGNMAAGAGEIASLLIDADARILRANAAADKLFFAAPGTLIGRRYGFPYRAGSTTEIELLDPEGTRIRALAHCFPAEWPGQTVYGIEIEVLSTPVKLDAKPNTDLLRALVAHSPLAIIAADLTGTVSLWNLAAVRMFGASDAQMRGQRLPDNAHHHESSLLGIFERVMDGETFQGVEVCDLPGAGEAALDVEVWAVRMNNVRGLSAGVVMMLADIGARKKIEAHIRRLVGHDALTGLPNRRQFHKQIQRLLHRKKRQQVELLPVLVMQIGLDRFRTVNESLGPVRGDQLLRDVSRRLAESIYESDLLARTGGDEFSILLRGTHLIEDGSRVADRLRECLKQPFVVGGQEVFLTASIGLAVAPDNGTEAEELIRAADSAMVRAKKQGGDICLYFTPELDTRARGRLVIENALHHAIDRGELFLEYQPQVSVPGGGVVGVEALLRWRHPDMGLISPANFIPLAENCSLIEPIGAWVIETACQQLHAWDCAGIPGLRLSINVSARQFRNNDLRDLLAIILAKNHLTPGRIELELTESMLMRDTKEANRMLERLKGLGLRLSIDDFGTGFSSLSYLANFPIDTLKIDQSFVRGADGQVKNGPIVRAICTLARGLGLSTIAEGVESQQQLDFLAAQRCDEVQGFFLARPMGAQALEAFIRERQSGTQPIRPCVT